jgi:beta-glucosidase-like glycosyl hydrolase
MADPTLSDAPFRDASLGTEERVEDLLSRMSLEEKIAQLTSVWLTVDPDSGEVAPSQFSFGGAAGWTPTDALEKGVGQITRPLGSRPIEPVAGAQMINEIQRRLVEDTRLGIPAICHEECLTGLVAQGATAFPSPLNLASTWDPDLARQMTDVIRRQMRSLGTHQGLAPVADVARDARWGRIEETLGEDPYLVGRFVTEYVRGLQGDDPAQGVIATLKHFVGYSFSEGGRNFAPTHVGPRELADVFLVPFEMAVRDGGARSVMNSYQDVDGEAPAASHRLLTEVLRGEWGFDGFTVADYGAVSFLYLFHRVAEGPVDASALAVRAGLDVELPNPSDYPTGLAEAVDRGLLDMADVDRSVRRVLGAKFALGLFDAPYVDPDAVDLDRPEERDLARTIARRSIILLSNDGTLPLPARPGQVAVIGPNAAEPLALFGNYSFENHVLSTHFAGSVADVVTAPSVLDVLIDRLGADSVHHEQGCEVMSDDENGIAAAVAAAEAADLAIVVVGDKAGHFKLGTVGEGTDTTDLSIPGAQTALVDAVLDTTTPTVVVLLNGRPFALQDVASRAAAIVEAWFPGQDGAAAVVDVLFGNENPGGRSPLTFSRSAGVQPRFYNHKLLSPGFPKLDDFRAVFPFGHGLSYTTFAYGDIEVGPNEVASDGEVTIGCMVSNTGERDGDEVVQLYLSDPVASVTRPVQELKGFVRVPLAAGAAARVTFTVPADLVAFTGIDGRRIVEPGELGVGIGGSSAAIALEGSFTVTGPQRDVSRGRRLNSTVTVEPVRPVGRS